jgi:protein-disulfide isomerase
MRKQLVGELQTILSVLMAVMFLALASPVGAQPQAQPPSKAPAPTVPPKDSAPVAPAFTPEQVKVNQRILDTIRTVFSVPPLIEMVVVGREPSKMKAIDTITIEVRDGANSSRQQVFVTDDSKFVLVARVFDLSQDPYAENVKKINLKDVPVKGNKDAKITIVEYSDFQCPYCGQSYRTMENEVMKQYGDKVKLVYKNFPLPIHAWAENASIAGLCALRQSNDAFWVLYKEFYEGQASITPENIKAKAMEFAAKAKLDAKGFEDCYNNKLTLPQVKAEMAEAQQLGLTGTPLFFINGRPLSGVQPFASFQKVIDEVLKKNSN